MADRLYRFLVDHDGLFHDLRLARHPSETMHYLLSRLLAYVLHFEPGLTFSRGLCLGGEPALSTPAAGERQSLWIDVGRPNRRKIARGLSRAERVVIYGYGKPGAFMKNIEGLSGDRFLVYWLETSFLNQMEASVSTGANHWQLSLEENTVTINGVCGTRTRLL